MKKKKEEIEIINESLYSGLLAKYFEVSTSPLYNQSIIFL